MYTKYEVDGAKSFGENFQKSIDQSEPSIQRKIPPGRPCIPIMTLMGLMVLEKTSGNQLASSTADPMCSPDTQGPHACLYNNSNLFRIIEKASSLAVFFTWHAGPNIVNTFTQISSISQFMQNVNTDPS